MIATPQILTPSRPQSKPIVVPPQPVFPIQPKPIILPQAPIVPVTPVKPEPVVIASKPEVF